MDTAVRILRKAKMSVTKTARRREGSRERGEATKMAEATGGQEDRVLIKEARAREMEGGPPVILRPQENESADYERLD